MAELAIGAVSAILIELVVPKILDKLNVNEYVKKEVQSMESWLGAMKAFVEDNGDNKEPSTSLKFKVARVRDIAFEIEDVLDEIVSHSPHVFHSRGITKEAHKFGHNIRHGFPRRGISEKIANIKRKIEDIKSQTKAFPDRCSSSDTASGSGSWIGHRVSPLRLDDEMVGYTNLKETFMSQLTDGEKSLFTLAVVGPAGSGKTTFIKNMFWKPRIRGRFDCHAWVHVSKEFDLKSLYINMLKQFRHWRKKSYDTLDTSEALTQLRKYLEKRRYIIVLDDIWKKGDWDCIKDALPNGDSGSRIIVSTRHSNIASSCASSPQFMYELKGLEWSDAWSLFCKMAFRDNNGECPSELEDYSSRIVVRCDRMPFAIVAVGSALAQKPKLPSEWEKFHKGLGCEIGSDPYLSAICNTLLSGYMDLSSNLKSCFLYFSIFPEDYSVERGRLIRLWVAERFMTGTNSKTAEEVAEDWLNELIHRNLVHVSNWDFDGRPRNCHVLSLVLTFIVQKCKEEIFASVYPQENTSATNKIRRLSVHGDCSHLPQNSDFAVIRSLFLFRCGIFSTDDFGDNFRNFKLLRILDLHGAPLTEFPEQITCLILLRYLSLRGTDIKTIPKSIKKLFYLKTLDLRQTGVTQLPEAISRLHNLRHLFVYKHNVDHFVAFDSVRGVKISEGIGNLTNLQKLSLVKVGQKDGIIRDLKKLRQLRKLGLTGIRREHGKALCASLEELTNLTTLDLCSNSEDEFLEVGEIQNPSPNIQRLYLKGRLKAFPGWISKLNSLQRIGLKWSKSKNCPLKALRDLPHLMELQLVDSFEGDKLEFEASTFKKLKILLIENFSRLNTVVIEEGALPELRKMNLHRCPNLMMLQLGINNLSKIEELVLRDMAEELIARLRKHSKDRQMVQLIPVIHSYTLNNQGWTLENLSGNFSA